MNIIKIIKYIEKNLKNKKITLNLAGNYGSKEEIVNAYQKINLQKK